MKRLNQTVEQNGLTPIEDVLATFDFHEHLEKVNTRLEKVGKRIREKYGDSLTDAEPELQRLSLPQS